MRLGDQHPQEVKHGLLTSENPFELGALQRTWDALQEDEVEWYEEY